MQLLFYPLLVFIIFFIVQLLLIEKKRKNKNAREKDINIEKEHKWNLCYALVYNLKEEVEGFMFWIVLDKNTISDEYPTINDIEIYDK